MSRRASNRPPSPIEGEEVGVTGDDEEVAGQGRVSAALAVYDLCGRRPVDLETLQYAFSITVDNRVLRARFVAPAVIVLGNMSRGIGGLSSAYSLSCRRIAL